MCSGGLMVTECRFRPRMLLPHMGCGGGGVMGSGTCRLQASQKARVWQQ